MKAEKVISQTIKDSIRKCADAAVFLEKIVQDVLNLRREKVAPKLNQKYKQMTFKTEDYAKLFWEDDLLKTIKDMSETNKAGQSLTQKYQPMLKRELFYQNREAFFIQKPGFSKEESSGRMFNHIRLTNKGNQSISSTRTLLCQTMST